MWRGIPPPAKRPFTAYGHAVTTETPAGTDVGQAWFGPGVAGDGAASFLADVGHEIPTGLLPSFLTSTLGAPASALGVLEGVSDALAGVARLGGGALADDPHRRRSVAVGGYTTTAVLSAGIGMSTAPWQAGVLRAGAWTVVPAGRHGDGHGATRVLAAGAICFAVGYLWFAIGRHSPVALAPAFILAGIGIGCAETAEHAAVAQHAPAALRGSAFGVLAAIQAAGNLAASVLAGVLWSAASPTVAFLFLAAAMGIAVPFIATTRGTAAQK